MILHSDREGNDCIWKLQCHCIQILHSDIYSVWSMKTCSRHQNSKASSPRKEFLEPRLGMCIFDFIDPNRSQFYAWFHLAMKYSWLGLSNFIYGIYAYNSVLYSQQNFIPIHIELLDQLSFFTINANWRSKSSPCASRFCFCVPVQRFLS